MVLPDIEGITTQYSSEHPAWDMVAPTGSPVIAADDGVVIYTQVWNGIVTDGDNNSYGHMVEIKHADGNITLYAHLSEINVQQGDTVVRGQQIGRVGDTGNATGAHLHFEVITPSGKADPDDYIRAIPGELEMSLLSHIEAGIAPFARGDLGSTIVRWNSLKANTPTVTCGPLGQMPSRVLKYNGVEYPAYCLQKEKGFWTGEEMKWSDLTFPQQTTIKAILAEGYSETGKMNPENGNVAYSTARWLVTQVVVWAAEKGYIVKNSNTSWKWDSKVDTDLETIATNAYNPSEVRSYYADLKKRILNAYVIPSFASSNSNASGATTINLDWNGSKYTATVTDTNSVVGNYTYTYNGITFSKSGNKLTVSTTNTYPNGVVATGTRSIGDETSLALWKTTDSSSNFQYVATIMGGTKTVNSYIKVKTIAPTYNIKLNKSSSNPTMTNGNSSYSLAGAVYNVYAGTVASGTIVATLTTDGNGKATSSVKLQNGTYAVKESTAPKGYKLDNTTYTVTINYDDATLDVKDEPIPMEYNINLTKTSADVSITNGDSGYSLSGAVYKVYNSSGTEVASITTDASGKGSTNVKLKNGTYTVVETTAPQGYALDTTRHTVTINNADAPLSVSDIPLIKTVTLTKTSANTTITAGNSQYSLAGAVYDVYEGNSATGTPVASFTTNESGVATLSRKLIPDTTYTILERTPPPGYVKDTTAHTFFLTHDACTMNVVDDPSAVKITVKKKDSGNGTATPAGNASLAGAVYRVFYLENGNTVYKDITTNANGVASMKDVPLGEVKIQEIAAPVGYKLDPTVHTYNVTSEQVTTVVYDLEPDFPEEVFKGKISITKQSEMLGAAAQIEQGAEYQVYLKSAGSYANAKESERDYLVTGADGKATTKDLPYGTYTLHQVKGVDGREFKDMDVDVHENGRTYEVTLTNELKYAPLKIVKTSEDGNVAGFTFKVTRLADGASATYTTNAAGEIITDQMPVYVDAAGTQKFAYRVEEINVPNQYRTPDPQTVTLMYGQTASVSFYNKISRGTLEILKVDHNGTTPLKDAVYKITDAGGTVIATKTTDATGKITVENLVYGSYHYQEITAPKGYDLDPTVYDFSIDYDEQIVAVTRENTPSIGSITFSKVDTGGNPMSGVEAALEYSTDNGATWNPVTARAADSKVSIGGCTSAGLTNGVLTTGSDGKAVFSGLQIDNQTVTILYRLTEVATQDNKMLMAETLFEGSLPVTLDGAERVEITISAVNSRNLELPGAGGAGMWLVPIGAAMFLVSLFCAVLVIKKSKKGKEN